MVALNLYPPPSRQIVKLMLKIMERVLGYYLFSKGMTVQAVIHTYRHGKPTYTPIKAYVTYDAMV